METVSDGDEAHIDVLLATQKAQRIDHVSFFSNHFFTSSIHIMTTTAKTIAKPAVKKTAKPAVKTPVVKTPAKTSTKTSGTAKAAAPTKTSAASQPSMRFFHSKELRAKTNAVLDALEAMPMHPKHGDAMAGLVQELIEAGMDYYFLRAVRLAKLGFVVEQSAKLGMSGAVTLVSSVSRKFIVRMDQNQLLVVAKHIRELTMA